MQQLPNLQRYSLRGTRAKVAFAHDLAMAAVSFLIALYLRVGGDFNYFAADFIIQATVIYTVIAGVVSGLCALGAAALQPGGRDGLGQTSRRELASYSAPRSPRHSLE